FPRTRSIVGREVAHCHPPKSLKVVEKLVEDFKAGRKDSESFWLQKGTKFILIRYYAVRNEKAEYLGVLEVTEEISSLRSLEGQKTLLSE
ncbi:MAG: PAS domain-containing protein, partial [Sphaerochaeta sp.]|nr:PAS domain-containing protein [Sphaerochaeta sp.]